MFVHLKLLIMRRYFSIFLCSLLILANVVPSSAQSDKNSSFKVSVGDFSYTPKKKKETVGSVLGTISKAVVLGKVTSSHDEFAESVRASVVKGFSGVRRFNTIDGYFKEGEVQENVQALYVEGTINNISTTTELFTPGDKDIKPYDVYKSLIDVSVNVKDAHDDHIVDSRIFYITEYDCSWVKSAEAAISNALIALSNKISKHYNKMFPLNARIIEPGGVKKDKQKELYIDLGSLAGSFEGLKLTVYSIKTVAGIPAQKELGTIVVREVMGEHVSLCKVQSGGKYIKSAIDEGMDVIAVSSN